MSQVDSTDSVIHIYIYTPHIHTHTYMYVYIYMYIYIFKLFSHIGYYKILIRVLGAIQQVLVGYLFHI